MITSVMFDMGGTLEDVFVDEQSELAAVRKEQAAAIADAFGADLNEIPEELRELERELQG